LRRQSLSPEYTFHANMESVKLARDGRHWNASEDVIAGFSFAVSTPAANSSQGTERLRSILRPADKITPRLLFDIV
jgi:hypothetical protein